MPCSSVPRSRRRLLGWLAGAAAVPVAGCTWRPTVQPRPGARRPAAPTRTPPPPLAGVEAGRAAELEVLAGLEAVATLDLDADDRARLDWCRTAHRRRVEVLLTEVPALRQPLPSATPATPDPTAPVVLPFPPLPTVSAPTSVAAGVKALAEELVTLVEDHTSRAVEVFGDEALLWASMAAGAGQEQLVLTGSPPTAPDEAEHQPYGTKSEIVAAQELLSQVHAMIFGYSVALTPIPAADSEPWSLRLEQHRQFRDRLAELLRDRHASVPAAEPEYETGDAADDPTLARTLVATMEDSLLGFSGAWVAACRDDERAAAVGWLVDGAAAAVRAGAEPRLWPGWTD